MAHHHHHHHSHSVSRKLTIATGANLLVVVGELAVGFFAGSLALVGDALHNLTDSLALIIALVVGARFSRRTATASWPRSSTPGC